MLESASARNCSRLFVRGVNGMDLGIGKQLYGPSLRNYKTAQVGTECRQGLALERSGRHQGLPVHREHHRLHTAATQWAGRTVHSALGTVLAVTASCNGGCAGSQHSEEWDEYQAWQAPATPFPSPVGTHATAPPAPRLLTLRQRQTHRPSWSAKHGSPRRRCWLSWVAGLGT